MATDDPASTAKQNVPKQEQRMVTYIISPPVKKQMDEVGPEGRVPLIISPAEDKVHPDCGVTTSIKAIKEYLGDSKEANVRDSDFYVFANLRPGEIEDLADRPEVWQIWLDHQT